MYSRYDLSPYEIEHLRLLQSLCLAAAEGDIGEALSLWAADPIATLTRRLVLVRPAARLEDFRCVYYGDEIQERFHVDFTGRTMGEIPELPAIRQSLDAFRLVAELKSPHISRVLRDQRSPAGVAYTRILMPILRHGETALVAAMFAFID